jgi:hypothetical protein
MPSFGCSCIRSELEARLVMKSDTVKPIPPSRRRRAGPGRLAVLAPMPVQGPLRRT